MPIGTLMKNPARHDTRSAKTPPITIPRLAPMPAVAAYQATAWLRSVPAGNVAVSRASEVGPTIAAPTPWNARADHPTAAGREGDRHRRDGEDDESDDEQPAATEDVAGAGAQQ